MVGASEKSPDITTQRASFKKYRFGLTPAIQTIVAPPPQKLLGLALTEPIAAVALGRGGLCFVTQMQLVFLHDKIS
jgi:hypothetical protein